MSKIADAEPIIAALVWDLPVLRRLDDPGAKLFIEVMNRRPLRPDAEGAETALTRAAYAVAAELQGQREQAQAMYKDIAQRDGMERLLGLCLQLWSATAEGPALLDEALDEIATTEDGELRARLYSKLISAALAHHWDSRLSELMDLALEAAPPHQRLAAALRSEAYNLGVRPLEFQSEPPPPDQLTDYRWISALADSADTKRLRDAVTQEARSPWTISFGFGATTTDDATTAWMQAEWAGALWLRRELQQQVATHVLLDRDAGADLTAQGLSLWILSGQQNIEAVTGWIENRFDDRSADLVIGQLDREEPLRPRIEHGLLAAAVALWDLISEETAEELLDRIEPHPSDHPVLHQASIFWATMSLRVPSAFQERFLKLEPPVQRALFDGLTPFTVRELPVRAAEALLAATRPPTSSQAHLYALLALRLGRSDLVGLDEASAEALIRLRRDAPQLVDDARLASAISQVLKVVREELADVRRGTRSFGPENPISLLALGLVNAPPASRDESLRVLAAAAADIELPADVRFDALRALTALAAHTKLPDDVVTSLREVSERGAAAMMGDFSPELMSAARLGFRAAVGEDVTDDALRMVRAEEPRIRQLAVEACGLALRRDRPSELLEAALANGLFDPAEKIVLATLDVLTDTWPTSERVAGAVSSRLTTLFQKGGRNVRAEVVMVAVRQRFAGAESILADAEHDRSYLVRRALMRAKT